MNIFTLAVFGNPIAHSVSPQIHQQFAAQCDIALDYQKILVPLDQFAQNAERFLAAGGYGFNVTIPFKVIAYEWIKNHTDRARQAGAVNTIFRQPNAQWCGDNTDGVGLVRDCQKKHIALTDQTIMVMGSGGAARGIIPALLAEKPAQLIVVCRDPSKVAQVWSRAIKVVSYAEAAEWLPQATVIFDASSDMHILKDTLSAQGQWSKDLVLYDLKYRLTEQLPVALWAANQGIRAYDGLGMLIEQAAEAFYQWFQVRPETEWVTRASLL